MLARLSASVGFREGLAYHLFAVGTDDECLISTATCDTRFDGMPCSFYFLGSDDRVRGFAYGGILFTEDDTLEVCEGF